MKNSIVRCSLALALCGLLPMSAALAEFTYVFSPSASGGVDVVGSGTGLVDRPDGIASNDWDVQDFVTNFMVLQGGGTIGADDEVGTFSNVTTGVTENIISFAIDEDGNASSDNDIDFDTANALSFSFNDEFSFSFSATFPSTKLTISDLVMGTHIDEGHTQGAGIAEESFGITTVHVVPEPSSMVLALACMAAAGVTRRRR